MNLTDRQLSTRHRVLAAYLRALNQIQISSRYPIWRMSRHRIAQIMQTWRD